MTKKEKKVIFTLVAIMVLIIGGIVLFKGGNKEPAKSQKETGKDKNNTTVVKEDEKYATTLEEGTKINNSTEFNKNKKYNNLEINDIQFTYKDGTSVLLANIKNTASTKHEAEVVKISTIGESGEVIDEIDALIPEIEAGQTEQLNASFSGADRVNVKDFKIEAK